jgi:glutathione S-transferase
MKHWERSGVSIMLHRYRYSVYLHIVRMVLAEKGVSYSHTEVNPFTSDMPEQYLKLHPFRRVPTLAHDDYVLYETQAITRYVDEAFVGAICSNPAAAARHDGAGHIDHRRLRICPDDAAGVFATRIWTPHRQCC